MGASARTPMLENASDLPIFVMENATETANFVMENASAQL